VVRAKETIHAIGNHFLILLCLIGGDFILKGILRLGQQVLGGLTVQWVEAVLSYFLIFIILIFTLFGAAELILHAVKSTLETVSRLFPKKALAEVRGQTSNEQRE